MDITGATITMEPESAQAAYEQYAAAVREFRDLEKSKVDESQRRVADIDAALAQGYKALASGKSLIQLGAAMDSGGFNDEGLPNLAIVRADAALVHVRVQGPSAKTHNGCQHGASPVVYRCESYNPGGTATVTFSDRPDPSSQNTHDVIELTMVYPESVPVTIDRWSAFRATVPTVPPQYRPGHHLRNYHLLFEPVWEPSRAPHRDPILLKHLREDLYAVLAAWDLTALEAAVLGR